MEQGHKLRKYAGLFILAWGGSFIFQAPMLRYVLYEPLREALQLSNAQFGDLQAWYGYSSTLLFLPGGWLADRVSPRKLLTFSFVIGGLTAFYFAAFPGYLELAVIHAAWGGIISLTFWAAMIRACKDMAASSEQGRFFGLMEGGRGLVNLFGTIASLLCFGLLTDQLLGLKAAIWVKGAGCFIAAALTWLYFEDPVELAPGASLFADILATLRLPLVWAMALIIFCAFSAFTIGSYMNPYLTNVSGFSATAAGILSTVWLYAGQLAASPVSGIVADRIGRLKAICIYFVLLSILWAIIIFTPGTEAAAVFAATTFILFYLVINAIRAIYFAIIEDLHIPAQVAGGAVGLASLIGFTPEIFTFKIAGPLLDKYPGAVGYKYLFSCGAVTALIGLALCLGVLAYLKKR